MEQLPEKYSTLQLCISISRVMAGIIAVIGIILPFIILGISIQTGITGIGIGAVIIGALLAIIIVTIGLLIWGLTEFIYVFFDIREHTLSIMRVALSFNAGGSGAIPQPIPETSGENSDSSTRDQGEEAEAAK